jgi:hypothetical protein
MGYDIHITRKENWFDDDGLNISIDEWKGVVNNDSEMRLDNFAETVTGAGEIIRIESDGLAVWTKYSKSGIEGNYAWFMYSNGEITVKNPDEEIINKMVKIAEHLNAKVQGDEGEIYPIKNNTSQNKKPRWKFW